VVRPSFTFNRSAPPRNLPAIIGNALFFLLHGLFQGLPSAECGNLSRRNGYLLAGFGIAACSLGAIFDFKGAESDEGYIIPRHQCLRHRIGDGINDESGLGFGNVGILADGADKFVFFIVFLVGV
jgi:hypothetical protein